MGGWCAWIVSFAPPFIFLVLFPLRLLVDWDAVAGDICTFSVRRTMNFTGSEIQHGMRFLMQENLVDRRFSDVVNGNVEQWCRSAGLGWHTLFYAEAVQCVWKRLDSCRKQVCFTMALARASIKIYPLQCYYDCLGFVKNLSLGIRPDDIEPSNGSQQNLSQLAAAFLRNNSEPCEKSREFKMPTPPALPPVIGKTLIPLLYERIAYGQRIFVVESSDLVKYLGTKAEYLVGTMFGIAAFRTLMTAALSLLGGLAESLINLKAIFPGSQQPAWMLIMTGAEALPMYVALLAGLQQIIGDRVLALACLLATSYIGVGMVTGFRSLSLRNNDDHRWQLYRNVWAEYGMRAVLILLIVLVVVYFVFVSRGWTFAQLRERWKDVRELLIRIHFGLDVVVDYIGRKIITAVAGTDALARAYVGAELWNLSMSESERTYYMAGLHDIDRLIHPERESTHARTRRRFQPSRLVFGTAVHSVRKIIHESKSPRHKGREFGAQASDSSTLSTLLSIPTDFGASRSIRSLRSDASSPDHAVGVSIPETIISGTMSSSSCV